MFNYFNTIIITRNMLRIVTRLLRRTYSSSIKQAAQRATKISKQQLLRQLAADTRLQLTPSILVSDEDGPAPRLTREQKLQLGLFIPSSPFNHRLTKRQEKEYLPSLTKDFYLKQQQQLTTYVKLLQSNSWLQNERVNLDYYINLLYKDIYARYLISKGVGVEWNGSYADYGVANPQATQEHSRHTYGTADFSVLLDFIQNHCSQLKKSKTIGMYNYKSRQFVHPSKVEVEQIKKMGYYIREELTEFGSFKDDFRTLEEKSSKVYLLVFVEQLEKLVNPNGIVINPNDNFYILKKYLQSEDLETEYLMLPKETYNKHQKYFKDTGYEKHSIFNSKYLLGMKAMGLPILPEVEEYQREAGAYLLNSSCHLADFQRAASNSLQHSANAVDEQGRIWIEGVHTDILVNDVKNTKQLEEALKERGVTFMDLYDIFQDEIYYQKQTNQVLKFRLGDKYQIEVAPNAGALIIEGLKKQGTIVSQSKIAVPQGVVGKKPRERRAFRKQKKQMMKQITEYYALQESLETINNIPITSLSQTQYQIYIFTKNDRVIPYEELLSEQELNSLIAKGVLEDHVLNKLKADGFEALRLNASDTLANSLLYLKNLSTSKDTLNVVIEPQSETEELIPYTLHLNYLINKRKSRRRIENTVKSNIKLIKLHPTLSEQYKGLDVMTIIRGVLKSNKRQQYGMGYEAMRLWTARHDSFLGDRAVSENQVNLELKHGQSIRRTFWELASLLPEQVPSVTPKLYISRFILDLMDSYIYRMDECYKHLDLNKAYLLTVDFFEGILHEIYAKAVRKRIIAYPNQEQNQEHFFVIRRIMDLVAVIAPLFPFTAFHISKTHLSWPHINRPKFYESLKLHNQMIRLRVKVVNKMRLNRLTHAQLYLQTLKEQFTERDLQLFFDLDKVTIKKPAEYQRQCSVELPKRSSVSEDGRLVFYTYDDHCLRCDSQSKQTKHLCSSCLDYLQDQVGENYRYFALPSRSNDTV